jgi:thioredoxin 1
MSGHVEVTAANFDSEVLKSDKPVLVDFWAEWCMPCKMISPILDDISKEMGQHIKIVKINVDDNRDISMTYNIRSIPTLLLFKNGQAVEQIIGAIPKKTIIDKIQPFF